MGLSSACFPARVAYGMVSLSIFFKVEQTTDSIALAGLAIGLNATTGSLTAGIRGSIIDTSTVKNGQFELWFQHTQRFSLSTQ
jgi:hypothetical protein